MKVLVLGSSGYLGTRLVEKLKGTSWATPTGASRKKASAGADGVEWLKLNACDAPALAKALTGFDAVVNCVAGDRHSISEGAHALVQAALSAGCPRIVHLSTMSVYGPVEGLVGEDLPVNPEHGWYASAKCQAETHMAEFVQQGGEVVMLRPGCIFGPGSELWVGRIGRWLKAGRLGDLGVAGDGWSNLVHVDDVCEALLVALKLPVAPGEVPVFNLAAPDSPRWNDYFIDLALGIEATPVARLGRRRIQLDSLRAGPPLKAAQRLLSLLGKSHSNLPDPMPPRLVRLWAQHIHLDATRATQKLCLTWTPYAAALQSAAVWFSAEGTPRNPPIGKAICTP